MVSLESPRDVEIDAIRKRKLEEMMKMAMGTAEVPNKILHINSVEEFEKMFQEFPENLIIIDFWAEWCGPCRTFGPVFEQTKKEYPQVVFAKLNVETPAGIVAQQLGVSGIPTIIFFYKGKMVHRQVGATNKAGFVNLINSILKKIQ